MSQEQLEKALFQMKHSICKIRNKINKIGTGFFCQIKIPNSKNYVYVMITNNHVLGKDELVLNNKISFTMDDQNYSDSIDIEDSTQTYTDIEKDVTIIETNYNEYSFIKYMDIDEDINRNNLQSYYRDTSVYIIHYEKGKKTKFSNGLIKSIKQDDSIINHICQTEHGSSGSPIINLNNYKVIGLHRGFKKGDEWNIGIMLTSPINDFMRELSKEKEINIMLNKKYLFKKEVKVIDSLFSLRKILGKDIKDDFIFAKNYGHEVDKIDENNTIIKKILKNNKEIEIYYKLLINKYSNTNPESNHELIYQYYYDKFNSDDYKNAYVIIFVGKNNQGKTKSLSSLLNIIKGISLDNKKRFTLTDLVGEYKECSSTEGFHIYYIKDYSGNPIILIDTPGFCNSSKGIKNDEKINELFYYIFSNIIEHINLICFTTINHTRLTREELYCFCNIMNLFTKDIKDNFISLITFADRQIMKKDDFFTKNIIKYLEIEDKINENNLYCFNNLYIFENIISNDTELSYNQLYKFYHEKVKNSKYISTKNFLNFIDYRINLKNKIKDLEQAFFEYFRNKNSNDYQGKIRNLISEIKNLIKSINEKSIYHDYIKIVGLLDNYIHFYFEDYYKKNKPEERDIIKNKKKIIKFIKNINDINNENILSFSIEELINKIA